MKITEGCASMTLDGRVATTAVSGLVFEVRRRVADAAAPDGRFMTLAVDGRVMTLALDGRFMALALDGFFVTRALDGRCMALALDGFFVTRALDGRFMTVGFTVFGPALTTIQLVIDTVDIVCLS